MPSIPLTVVWISVLCGYLPYSMGFQFLNPIIIVGYGFLGLLVAANLEKPWHSYSAALGTTATAILMVNVSSGIPEGVFPSVQVLLSSALLSITSVFAGQSLRARWLRRGLDPSQIRFRLRLAFTALALSFYGTSYLPFEQKVWIAEHTTSEDLTIFATVSSVVLVAIGYSAKRFRLTLWEHGD